LVSRFDYEAFSKQGKAFLRNVWPPEIFDEQRLHASPEFRKEQEAAGKAVERKLIQNNDNLRLADMEDLLKNNLLIALVDAGKLAGVDDPSSHWVFIYGWDHSNFFVHDPGLPSRKKCKVSKSSFFNAFRGDIIVIPKK
jgi:hypothetical protein